MKKAKVKKPTPLEEQLTPYQRLSFYRSSKRLKEKKLSSSEMLKLEKDLGWYKINSITTKSKEWVQLSYVFFDPNNYKPLMKAKSYQDGLERGAFLSFHNYQVHENERFKGEPPLENYIIRKVEINTAYKRFLYLRTPFASSSRYGVHLYTGTEKNSGELIFTATNPYFKEELLELKQTLEDKLQG